MKRTISQINEKIKKNKVFVMRADEFCRLVEKEGVKEAYRKVDVVTTGTFGAMCSSGVWLNFGHSNPPIKMIRVFLNNVEVYTGVAAVDGYIGATQMSLDRGIEYGGAHVIQDLLEGKEVVLRAVGYGSDCYPRKRIVTRIRLEDLNFALLQNPRNAYQRYNAATNGSNRIIHTYMGKLLPKFGNITFSGSGELSPLQKDPQYQTIGIGTRIFLGGAIGYITGAGTQHNPENGLGTLMVQGELKKMSTEFIRAATFTGYGSTLYVGVGLAIPLLSEEIAVNAARSDRDIETTIIDYGSSRLPRRVVRDVTYSELKSGSIEIEGKNVPTAPLSSLKKAERIADVLKDWIYSGKFLLSEPAERLPSRSSLKPLVVKRSEVVKKKGPTISISKSSIEKGLCIECGQCLGICPKGVFYQREWSIVADFSRCNGCLLCSDICPTRAIRIKV